MKSLHVHVVIRGNPVSWARMRQDPRHRNRRGMPRTFEDPTRAEARATIARALLAALMSGEERWRGPTATSQWKLSALFSCETKRRRDLDRLVSLVMDAATGVVYADDSQVCGFKDVDWKRGFKAGEGRTEITFIRVSQ